MGVFSFGFGLFCPSLLSCMLWFCVGRAHWYLVVVCFPGLEEARYEEFQRRAGELTWFLSQWLNESCLVALVMFSRASLMGTRRAGVYVPLGGSVLGYLGHDVRQR